MVQKPALSAWVEQLQARGRYTFTRDQAESQTERSFVAAQTALRRLKEQGRIVSPRRGFFVIVPPEYRSTGSPPASWFIDDLMDYLSQPYYVGLLSAAAIHGAAHQQPMVFQVITSVPTREVRTGRVTIQFSMNSKIEQMPVTEKQTETGTMRVATPETTALDLVRYRASAGHFSNVATVLRELAEQIDARALASTAGLVSPPDAQRLGYVLDAIGEHELADPLAEWVKARKRHIVLLSPGEPRHGKIDKRWHVRPNVELEVDV